MLSSSAWNAKRKKEKEVFTAEEIETLWNNINVPFVDTILILMYTGLRINEMLILKKESVDFENNIITGGLKTDAGKDRSVPIHSKILPIIKKWYSSATSGGPLIFKNDNQEILADYYRKHIYYKILDNLNIKRRVPHTTRHTCATLLAQAGVDTIAIKQILGHTEYAFTADTYTHTDYKYLQNQINKI